MYDGPVRLSLYISRIIRALSWHFYGSSNILMNFSIVYIHQTIWLDALYEDATIKVYYFWHIVVLAPLRNWSSSEGYPAECIKYNYQFDLMYWCVISIMFRYILYTMCDRSATLYSEFLCVCLFRADLSGAQVTIN